MIRIRNLAVPVVLLAAFFCGHRAFFETGRQNSVEAAPATAAEDEAYRKDEDLYNAAWASQLAERSADVKDFQRLFPGAEIQPPGAYAGPRRKGDRHVIIVKTEWHLPEASHDQPCSLFLYIPFRVGADRETIVMIEPVEELSVEPDNVLLKQRHFREGDWWSVLKSHHGDLAALGRF